MVEARILSTLSTKGRVARLLELAEGNHRIVRARHMKQLAKQEEARAARCRAEFEKLEKAAARAIRERDRRNQLFEEIDDSFAKTKLAGKIAAYADRQAFVLAYTETANGTKKVLLEVEEDNREPVWSGCGAREAWIVSSPARQPSSRRRRAFDPGASSPGFPIAQPRTGGGCESRCCHPNPFGPKIGGGVSQCSSVPTAPARIPLLQSHPASSPSSTGKLARQAPLGSKHNRQVLQAQSGKHAGRQPLCSKHIQQVHPGECCLCKGKLGKLHISQN